MVWCHLHEISSRDKSADSAGGRLGLGPGAGMEVWGMQRGGGVLWRRNHPKVMEVSSELCEILTAVELYPVNERTIWCKNCVSTKLLL